MAPSSGDFRKHEGDSRSDEELVEDFLAGDVNAFSRIVERHRARLMNVARSYAHNEADAQDIMQEAWLKACTHLDSYRAEAKLSTWLNRVVTHKGYDFLRHRYRKEITTLDVEDSPLHLSPQLIVDPYEGVERGMMIRQALHQLPVHQRVALVLVDMLGFTVEETADELDIRPGTVKSRRARARKVAPEIFAEVAQ